MPTINAIANQARMVADVSRNFFGFDTNAAQNSAIVGGVFDTLRNAINSEFGGQPALNNLIESYRERREAFQEELRENVDSLRSSADRLRETTQAENSTTAENTATATADRNTGSTLSTLTEFARGNIPPQESNFVTATRAEQRAERTEPQTPTVNRNAANNLNALTRNYLTAAQNDETDETESDTAVTAPATENSEQTENARENANAERTDAVANENRAAANPANTLNDFARNYLTAETEEVEDVAEINAIAGDTGEDNRLNSVLNLVRDYNATVNYLNENRGVSSRMNALASNFRNNPLNESLRNIGITVNSTGELTINETALNLALDNDAEGVNEILGSEGLAGRLERDIDRANAQGDRLFPNIVDFARNRQEDVTESLYTARTLNTAAYAWENTGRLLSAMFT